MCSCTLNIETTHHYLLHYPNFTNKRSVFLNTVLRINKDILTSWDSNVIKLLIHADESLDLVANTLTLNVSVDFLLLSKRFDGSPSI